MQTDCTYSIFSSFYTNFVSDWGCLCHSVWGANVMCVRTCVGVAVVRLWSMCVCLCQQTEETICEYTDCTFLKTYFVRWRKAVQGYAWHAENKRVHSFSIICLVLSWFLLFYELWKRTLCTLCLLKEWEEGVSLSPVTRKGGVAQTSRAFKPYCWENPSPTWKFFNYLDMLSVVLLG